MKKDIYLALMVLFAVVCVGMCGIIGYKDAEIEHLKQKVCPEPKTYIYYEDFNESCMCEEEVCICMMPDMNE